MDLEGVEGVEVVVEGREDGRDAEGWKGLRSLERARRRSFSFESDSKERKGIRLELDILK